MRFFAILLLVYSVSAKNLTAEKNSATDKPTPFSPSYSQWQNSGDPSQNSLRRFHSGWNAANRVDGVFGSFPVLEKISATPPYAVPGKGSVLISAEISDVDGLIAAVFAEIITSDSMAVDTLQLYDDGMHADGAADDGQYANFWPLKTKDERHYGLNILAADNLGILLKYWTDVFFTSIGPLRFVEFVYPENDATVSPNEHISLQLRLQNNGTRSGAEHVEAVISIQDAYVKLTGDSLVQFEPSISALAVATSSNMLVLNTRPDTPHNHLVHCRLAIKSNGYLFWQDSCDLKITDDKPPLLSGFDMPKFVLPGQPVRLAATFIDAMGVKKAQVSFQSLTDSTVDRIDLLPDAENVLTGNWTVPEKALENYDIDLSVKDYLDNSDTLVNLAGFTTIDFSKKSDVLLMDDDGYNNPDHSPSKKPYESYYQEALDSCHAAYDVYSDYFYGKPDTALLSLYLHGVIIWETGDTRSASTMDNKIGYIDEPCLTRDEVAVLQYYLDHGGRLLLSGQGIGYDVNEYQSFFNEYLGCDVLQANASSRRLQKTGHFLTPAFPAITMIKGGSGADNQLHPSGLATVNDGVEAIFSFTLGEGVAGVSFTRDNGSRIVFFSFGFEALEDRTLRIQLMKGILDYLFMNVAVENRQSNPLPHAYALYQNFPNPFNAATTIRYDVPEKSHVKIELFNMTGQIMDVLADRDELPGVHEIKWNADPYPSGIYIVRLRSKEFIQQRKLLFIK